MGFPPHNKKMGWRVRWVVVACLLLLLVYHFSPSDQLYLRTRWERIQDVMKDRQFEIPDWALPEDDIQTHYKKRGRLCQHWGSPTRDGPDRNMPDDCYWRHGFMWCKQHV